MFHFATTSSYSRPRYTVKNCYSRNLLTLTLSLYFFLSLAQDTSTNIRVTSFFARYCGSNGIQLCKKTQMKIPYFSLQFYRHNGKKGRRKMKETKTYETENWDMTIIDLLVRWFKMNNSSTKEIKKDGLLYLCKG